MEKLFRDCQTKTRAFRGAAEIEAPNVCATLVKRNCPQETAAHLKSESATVPTTTSLLPRYSCPLPLHILIVPPHPAPKLLILLL
eukprot:3902985-Pyramimonas_sp.AAC.1